MSRIAILNYGVGNVRSIANALEKINATALVTRDRNQIMNSDGLILPGVGAFAHGMKNLEKYNLISYIKDFVSTGKPFLGICLGMQLLMQESDEFGATKGLGLIEGSVNKLPLGGTKIPNITWNGLIQPQETDWSSTILNKVSSSSNFYFIHSFVASPSKSKDALAFTSFNNEKFCSVIKNENVYGVQFHPEKSAEAGLQILKNFIKLR